MRQLPPFDQLVAECVRHLDYKTDYNFLERARFFAALNWLKTDPSQVLKIAAYDKQSARTMLIASAVFLLKNKSIPEKTKTTIATLMLDYDELRTNAPSGGRFRQIPRNIQINLIIFMLKDKYGLNPTRSDVNEKQISGCDVVASACLKHGLKSPRTYEGARRIWTNRKKYLSNLNIDTLSDENMFNRLMDDPVTYVKTIAAADAKS